MANPFFVQPAQYGPALQQAAGAVQQFGQQRQEEQRRQEAEAYKQEAKAALSEAVQKGDPLLMRNVAVQYPEVAETMHQVYNFTNDQTKQIAIEGYSRAIANPDRAADILEATSETISQFGGTPRITMRDAEMMRRDPEAGMKRIMMGLAGAAPDVYDRVVGKGESDLPAGVREFEATVKAAGLEPGSEGYQQAALISLGIEPRAGISASERIANNPELASRVAALEEQTTAAGERGRLSTQVEILPKIRASVKEAEQAAKSRGEALSEYDRARASMPGLQEVVGKLKTLSDVATYTMGGKVFDSVVKELGFGATDGATARAKMESLVNNQILPLLRDTFGAQFTEREGERLQRTMLDFDAAPEQKKQILDSFLEQKMRDLEMKRGRVDTAGGGGEGQMSEEEADAFIDAELEK